jgi:hypothetical protein
MKSALEHHGRYLENSKCREKKLQYDLNIATFVIGM